MSSAPSMLRKFVGQVVRNTPGLRQVRELIRGKSASPSPAPVDPGPRFGAEQPRADKPPAEKTPAEKTLAVTPPAVKPPAEKTPAEKTPAEKTPAEPKAGKPTPVAAAAPVAEKPPAADAAPDKPAGKKASGKKAASKDASAKKDASGPALAAVPAAASEPAHAARDDHHKDDHHKKDQAEIEALRAEAEHKKAEIRARKEAEAKAAAPAPAAAGGIAAMIAKGGGTASDVANKSNVSATSGIDWAPDDTDVHQSDDGVEYWGSIDNESSRAYARGDTLIIDQWECINCGTCVENTEHVFVLPTDAKAVVINQEGPMDLIQDAIDACPVTCIHWTDNPTQYEQINDAEGHSLG